ncbi:MAG TPA: SDR family NAD(P)-dependent oxidoreductase [Gemmatimonadaceae bacterium]|nr:SDR family NAD(P)-dependent oxidoreductase [Gemmatimonadaceae bacterium]
MTAGIAVVGAACRFPDANSPRALWETALAGRRAFRRVPPERLRLDDYASSEGDADSVYVREAAVLEGYQFDRVAFHVSGDAYRSADLAHWLALDVANDALRDAGFPEGDNLPRERTGVLLGNTLTGEFSRAGLMRLRWPYVRRVVDAELVALGWDGAQRSDFLRALAQRYKAPFVTPGSDTLAGGLSNTIAGRICNHFDFGGGGYTVDGACASSLLAVARGCAALESGELDAAIVGGVDLSLDPFELVGFSRAGALAHDGMRVFDSAPTGFLPGEGCGMVVLMRDTDALARGCQRYAVIRGWGISSDGAGGLTRPEVHGQLRALRRAYERAGIDAASVGYFEGHGTGTAVGDATELRALTQVRRDAGAPTRRAALGTVKANIGHTKAAAGIAGVIKTIMALRSQILPPTIGCHTPHATLLEPDSALRVLTRGERWPRDVALRAAVSGMGFGGINVHVVLDGVAGTRRRALASRERALLASAQDVELFLLTGADLAELSRSAASLAATAASLAHCELADLSSALLERYNVALARGAVIASSPAQLAERLSRLAARARDGAVIDVQNGVFIGHGADVPRIGLLFPGQGTLADMAGSVLRARFPTVDALYRWARLPSGGDAVATDVAQPAIVTGSVAALRILAALGIDAVGAVGHSLGELTALHWGGALDLDALLRIARVRGRAMADLGAAGGRMAAVAASEASVRTLLDRECVVVAGVNAPRQTVISGDATAVEQVMARARAQGIAAHTLATSHAFHSPLVAAAEAPLRQHLSTEITAELTGRVASTVLGRVLTHGDDLRQLLCSQVTSPVRFLDAVRALADSVDLWIEAGPGRVLAGLLDPGSTAPVVSMDVCAPSPRGVLEVVAAAHALGAPITARALIARRFVRPFDLARRMTFLANPCEQAPTSSEAAPRARARSGVSETDASAQAIATTEAKNDDALHVVRRLVAARAELPIETVRVEQLLLRDLHLNSIVVAQIASEAARELSLAASVAPTEFSAASVGELARALEQRLLVEGTAEAHEHVRAEVPEGATTWVRPFTMRLVERPLPAPRVNGGIGEWRVIAVQDDPLAAVLREMLPTVAGNGVAALLPAHPSESHVAALLDAARALLALPAPRYALFVQRGGGATAFARTLHLEVPDAVVCVVDVPGDASEWARCVVAEVAGARGFVEAHYDVEGRRYEPVFRPLSLGEGERRHALTADDVVLVTGGGKGIAAECVQTLGIATGARFALIGRSSLLDAEVVATLERLANAGIVAHYVTADVTDAVAVAAAVAGAERALGPVTAIIHAAGINDPCLVAALDEAAVQRTLAPKLAGLRNVVATVDPARLRLLVTFASTIGRSGLRGAAGYALANDWTAALTERIGRERPHCRCVALEWSIWAGAGMGTKLGQLGTMAREGVTAVMPAVGAELCRRLLSAALPDARILVMGRYGAPPLLPIEAPELPLLRFLERVRVHYHGVELVADAVLSNESDPYLADHAFAGEQLLPGVIGLEAMAQVVVAVTGIDAAPAFEMVEFARPIVVPRAAPLTIRIAAVVRESGEVDVVVRSEESAFAVDHFRARCRVGVEMPVLWRRDEDDIGTADEHEDAAALYGDILFQSGRFRRLESYRLLRSRACDAVIALPSDTTWFGPFHSQRLILGDPAARDVALHAIQACVPHRTLLPRSARGITSAGVSGCPPFTAHAQELSSSDDLFTYALEVTDADGRVCEQWKELQFRVVRAAPRAPRVRALLGPYFERRMAEVAPGTALAARVLVNGAAKRGMRTVGAARSHSGSLLFTMTSAETVSCDVEPVRDRPEAVWRDLLTASRVDLVDVVCRTTAEPRARAATRVWSAAECLTKVGMPPGAPLTLDDVASDGWIQFRSGDAIVATYIAELIGEEWPLSFALLVPAHG